MKVLFVLPDLECGGAERVTVNFIKDMVGTDAIVSLVVFQSGGVLQSEVPACVKLYDLSSVSAKKSIRPLYKLIKHLSPDIVFSTHSRVSIVIEMIKLFSNNLIHIARVPSMPSMELAQGYVSRNFQKVIKLALRRSDLLIAQTGEMKDDLIRHYHFKNKQITVVSNPVDKQNIRRLCVGRSSPFKSRGRINLLASGRHTRDKGFDILIDSMPAVLAREPRAHLTILGRETDETEALVERVKKQGVESSVSFEGFKRDPYIYYFYCDVFVLSSRREGFPNSLIENYVLNTPVAASKCIPVVESLVQVGVNGFLSEVESSGQLADAIVKSTRLSRKNISNKEYVNGDLYGAIVNIRS